MKNKNNKTVIIVLCFIMLLLIAIPVRSYLISLTYKISTYLPNNLYMEDINLGGMTLEQAKAEIDRLVEKQQKKPIIILYDDGRGYYQSHSFTYGAIGCYGEKDKAISELSKIFDPEESILERFISYKRIEAKGAQYNLSYGILNDKFLKALETFDNSKLKPPVDARYDIKDGKVEIIQEEYGYAFDKESLYKELLSNMALETVKLNIKSVKPVITAQQLETQGVKELVASFTTRFDAGNAPRSSNIKLAASLINDRLLPPGATFSFNETVGERTEKRGFKEAGVYINGKIDTGIGGGICQVSTTLYNAVLLADLQVIERSNHSLTVPYVPLSRDAAVSWGAQDLKFQNNTESYILIHCSTTKNTITFELYSTKTDKEVELVSTTISRSQAPVQYIDDAAAFIGKEEIVEKGNDGYQSQLIKNIFINGKMVASELVSKDKYLPVMKVIKRGVKVPEALLELEEGF